MEVVRTQQARAITVELTMRKMTLKGNKKTSSLKRIDFLYNAAALTLSSLHWWGTACVVSGRTRYCLADMRVHCVLESRSWPTRILFLQT
jgi:hypothetical protein